MNWQPGPNKKNCKMNLLRHRIWLHGQDDHEQLSRLKGLFRISRKGVWGVWVMIGVQGKVAFGLSHFCILSFFF